MARPRKRLAEHIDDTGAADALGPALAAAERALADALTIAEEAGLHIRSRSLRRRLARALGLDGDG